MVRDWKKFWRAPVESVRGSSFFLNTEKNSKIEIPVISSHVEPRSWLEGITNRLEVL